MSEPVAVALPFGRRRRVVELLDRAARELVPMRPRYVTRYLERLEAALHDLASGADDQRLAVAALRIRMFREHWPERPNPKTNSVGELRWTRDLEAMVTIDLPRIRDAIATFDRSRLTPLRMNPPHRSRAATKDAANRRKHRASR